MTKSTDTEELTRRHNRQHWSKLFGIISVYKNLPRHRKDEVVTAHLRKRKKTRKLHGVAAVRMASSINSMNELAAAGRRAAAFGVSND